METSLLTILGKADRGEAIRVRIKIKGAVQGVGFRPFIYRIASEMALKGFVRNDTQGVAVEVEGSPSDVERFVDRIHSEKPARSLILSLETSSTSPVGYTNFAILPSDSSGGKDSLIMPDAAVCPECLSEIFDPRNRRYLYPFTHCTQCGPRFSILSALPYDRKNTTMSSFELCEQCQAEYENPRDRRFHDQVNACSRCGPHVELWCRNGRRLHQHHKAVLEAASAVARGQIIALKAMGGYQLITAASNSNAIYRLREMKQRLDKPFALMYPSLELLEAHCEISAKERELLTSPARPIVLLRKRNPFSSSWDVHQTISPAVVPDSPYLGVMLPCTPLQYLLMSIIGVPVVATSGNRRDEPICISEEEALNRLGGVADFFLIHNRLILRHLDDSVARVIAGRETLLRRARGYTPLAIALPKPIPSTLAVGGQLKNTVCATVGDQAFVSQHIGDLRDLATIDAFLKTTESFKKLYDIKPAVAAADLHPDYASSRYAQKLGIEVKQVQHHVAHVLACMAENQLELPVLGVSWDGAGYGTDGTVWGGEFIRVSNQGWDRVAHLATFRLPGGEKAVQEPRRSALGLLYEIFGEAAFDRKELKPVSSFTREELRGIQGMLRGGLNSPYTSSAGRLFDAVASLLGLRQRSSFEGQAGMDLEFAAESGATEARYSFSIMPTTERNRDEETDSCLLPQAQLLTWDEMILEIIQDSVQGVSNAKIAAKFQNTLAEMIVTVAQKADLEKVALSGGCFQNKYLMERTIRRLEREGFRPYWHHRVPCNDGGISLGQVMAVVLDEQAKG